MKRFLKWCGLVICALVGVWWYYCGPGFSGRVAHLKLDDGSEYVVTQSFNGIGEPYAIHFYERLPGKEWGWNYLDHQSFRWREAALRYDAEKDVIKLAKGEKLMATLDRKRRVLIFGTGSSKSIAPQVIVSNNPHSQPGPVY